MTGFVLFFGVVFFFAVFAAVYFFFFIGKEENVGQALLNGSDAAGVFALDDVFDFLGENQFFFVYDFSVFNDVDGNVVVDKGKDVQIQHIDVAFYFQDVFFAHFVAAGVFDNGNGTVQLVQLQMMVKGKALSGFNMV